MVKRSVVKTSFPKRPWSKGFVQNVRCRNVLFQTSMVKTSFPKRPWSKRPGPNVCSQNVKVQTSMVNLFFPKRPWPKRSSPNVKNFDEWLISPWKQINQVSDPLFSSPARYIGSARYHQSIKAYNPNLTVFTCTPVARASAPLPRIWFQLKSSSLSVSLIAEIYVKLHVYEECSGERGLRTNM